MTGQINNQVLVGDQLGRQLDSPWRLPGLTNMETASNQDFSEAAMRYSHDVVIAMEICRHIPAFLVPYVFKLEIS